MDKDIIRREAQKELARRDFFYFCHLSAPSFYREDRGYLKEICYEMQDFYESDDDAIIINVPPRFGKSRTASKFVEWVFGQNITEKVMTGSYNEVLSTTFSKAVRNAIQEEKGDADKIVYSDIFPDVRIKQGDGAMNLWSLEGGYNNYLATSPTGTATGFGCSLMIIDDLIKNAEEAYNETVKEKHWEWFTNTMLSRLEEGGKIIIIMTRWASGDLAGKAIEFFKENGYSHRVITMKAVQDDGSMLCDEILSRRSYDLKIKAMGADIASANYQQEPIDIRGKLYTTLKTYKELPEITQIRAYCDTADEGADYLCNIIYGVYNNEAYVIDVYYTNEPMEVTESETAKRLYENKVNLARIESNNGGKGFARSVKGILSNTYNTNRTTVNWFHQSNNKIARILSNSTWVMEHIYFPEDWYIKYPEYYTAMTTYQREGKNKHDDAPDATTGIAEDVLAGQYFDNFDSDMHTVEPFELPEHWHRYRAIDYRNDNLGCLWIAIDEQGSYYVYCEYVAENIVISEGAAAIIAAGGNIDYSVAPSDMWNSKNDMTKSQADLFYDSGLLLIKGSNDREAGRQALKTLLNSDGKIKIFKSCERLVSYLPVLGQEQLGKSNADELYLPDILGCFALQYTTASSAAKKEKTELEIWREKALKGGKRRKRYGF